MKDLHFLLKFILIFAKIKFMARLYYFTFHENTIIPSEGIAFLVDNALNPDNLGIEIYGTATSCIIKFQAQISPDGEWRDVAGLRASDFFLSSVTTRVNEIWIFDISSFHQFRVNIAELVSGNITIKGKISKTT